MPAFILGNSPLLPVKDLDCLAGQFTIGVNRILQAGFTPTVILWVDRSVYKDGGADIDASGALLVCDKSVAQTQHHIGLRTRVGDEALRRPPRVNELSCNGNTGCCAARWAAMLGCRPIYLLGMEAEYRGDTTDFYGVNKRHHNKPGDNGTLMVMRSELGRLKNDLFDIVQPIPDGLTLRQIVGRLPEWDQGDLRGWVKQCLV